MKRKRITAAFWVAAAFLLFRGAGAASAGVVDLRTFWKESYPMEDTVLKGIEPNVLFFLDTSSSMTMSMRGELPTFYKDDDIMRDSLPLMRDATERAAKMKDCTYGTGTRPLSTGTINQQASRLGNDTLPVIPPYLGAEQSGWERYPTSVSSLRQGYTRYGKDMDASNNIVGDPYSYYSPDPGRPYLLTFRDLKYAASPPSHWTTDDLVPNDSKMYQMKLVLWHLLSEENAEMLSKMRIGVATNFFDCLPTGIRAPLYRRAPYRSTDSSSNSNFVGGTLFRAYHAATDASPSALANISFPHGTAPEVYVGIPGGDYGHAETVYSGVFTTYDTGEINQRHAYRAYFRVPFDYMYTQKNGLYYPTSSLIMFQELIDGVEQMNLTLVSSNPALAYVNEELIAGGTTLLASSFYGRNGLHATGPNGNNLNVLNGQKAITYATGTTNARSFHRGMTGTNPKAEGVLMRRFLNSENLMGGSALGSAVDFFSPFKDLPFTVNAKTGDASDTRGYFPVTGSCQPNWLVVFTGGNEKAIEGRNPVESLLQLYDNSKEIRGRHWDGAKWTERIYAMDHPIRTIFVGMVSTEGADTDGDPYIDDLPTDSGAKRLRKSIRRMAHAGQPFVDSTGMASPDKTINPYFADNVPALLNALQSILQAIRAEPFGSGAPVILPSGDSDESDTMFEASYQVNMMKQWTGGLTRYRIPEVSTDVVTTLWDAETEMERSASTRSVYTMNQPTGGSETDIGSMSDAVLAFLTGTPEADAPKFKSWLLKYDGEASIMGDTEHSGITVVGDAKLSGIASRDKRVYIQTNRGVLHALDYETGKEEWAFIPPNIFQHRIKDQKFLLGDTWYDGDGASSIMSRPLCLLDGMLSASDAETGSSSLTFLLGAMGWGGNGFYAMDITAAGGQPKFLWAIDNARYAVDSAPLASGVKRWGAAASGSDSKYDYSRLGLTIAAPEVRSTSGGYVGIIPGGLGYRLGANDHGKAFYVFDPRDGSILREMNNSSYSGTGSLGMGITPLSYITTGGVTTEFFTGDSEGNVLRCDMTTGSPSSWTLKNIFRLRSTATGDAVAITKTLNIGKTKAGDRWLFGGTSDLAVPDYGDSRTLANDEQYIFALNLATVINKSPVAVLSDLAALKYIKGSPDIEPSYGEPVGTTQIAVPSGSYGWVLKLRPKIADPTLPTEGEYVTTSPYLYDGVLYVSTFIARTRHPDDMEQCPELGDSKLYALDPLTGRSKWDSGVSSKLFSGIKISGFSASKGMLYLSIKQLKGNALESLRNDSDVKNLQRVSPTALRLGAPGYSEGGEVPDITPYLPHLQYWKEAF